MYRFRSIDRFAGKIKSWGAFALACIDRREVFAVLGMLLTGLAAFFAGRIVAIEEKRPPVQIRQAGLIPALYVPKKPVAVEKAASAIPAKAAAGAYVASKNGKKYYLPTCSGAKSILEANKVWFASKADAERAGYTAAGNCKGI